jgi:hypothetical protein
VTYPAHVILRYRLEKALIADAMPLVGAARRLECRDEVAARRDAAQ